MADDESYDDIPGSEDEQLDEAERSGDFQEQKIDEAAVAPNPLTGDNIGESLSLLCKTGDGLSHAYVRLDIHDRKVTDISIISTYIHLRYIDICKNSLKDISALSSLTHMLTLKANENLLTHIQLDEMPYLQSADFSNNRLGSVDGVNHPMMEHLLLNYNNITEVSCLSASTLQRLHTLELRGNKLGTTAGIHLQNLKNLFLAGNAIRQIEGLSRCPNITTLHLRDNQLDNLDGFSSDIKELQYVNLRGNLVRTTKEIGKLKDLPFLRALVLSENPVVEEDEYRLETLITLRTLERLDKDEYTDDERHEAEEIYELRMSEADAAETGMDLTSAYKEETDD